MMNASVSTGGPTRYTIEHRDNCILVFGALPLDAITGIFAIAPKKAVIDPTVAKMAGANFAFGLPADLTQLREKLTPAAEAREARKPANKGLSPAAVKWLASGERGISSNTLFQFTTGVVALGDSGPCHPWDPADFRRCCLLLDQCPELRSKMHVLGATWPTWGALIERWDEIFECMTQELGDWRNPKPGARAKKTYQLMKSIIFPLEN